MKKNESIRKIMTENPETVHLGMKLSEVRGKLQEAPFHHLPVVDGKKLIGMISTTDVLGLVLGHGGQLHERQLEAMLDHSLTIDDVMTKNITTLDANQMVRDGANLLSEGVFHALPVVEGDELVGIVTSTDLIRYLVDQY